MSIKAKRIPTKYARKLAKNYAQHKIGKKLLEHDSRAVWFPKDVIKDALGEGEDPNPNISGIRFYFGAYENNANYPKDPRYHHMLTLVMVQTELRTNPDGTQDHKDILQDPDAKPDYPDIEPMFVEFNDGQICPPPNCDSAGLLRNV